MSSNSVSAERSRFGLIAALLAALIVVVALLVFSQALTELVRRWNTQEEYSHGYFIPAITLWLLWTRRQALRDSIGRPSWLGPAVILIAGLLHAVGELSALYLLSQVAFVLVLMGVVLGIGGFSLLRVAFIPIAFLLFAIPLPYFVDTVLSWRLQLISSELGVAFIRLFQIPVYLEGNVIDLGKYQLQVVEACSGLRYLYPLLSLGFLAAYFFHAPMWKRVVVFLSTVPITIVMNSIRIGIVGILVDSWGPQSADGLLHFFEGWIIFVACAGILAAEMFVLARLGGGGSLFSTFRPPIVNAVLPQGTPWLLKISRPLVASFCILCIAGLSSYSISGRQEVVPQRTKFATFPTIVADWRGRASSLEPQVEHFLGLTDYVLSNYAKSDGRSVNLYVAYYELQRKGQAPHSPSVCIPGNGWNIAKFERTRFVANDPQIELPYNRVVIEKSNQKQIVYYWFEQRGRKIDNEWWSKWYLLRDAVIKNRTDGALVRLTTPVYPGEAEADADQRLRAFVRDFVPKLAGYLPPENPTKVMPAQIFLDKNHS